MSRFVIGFFGLALLASCAITPSVPPAARADLAPTGKLRAGINFQNPLLTRKDPVSGEAGGIAVDLARELARRLGVPIEIVAYTSAGQLADAARSGAWDVGFLGAEPQRAAEISFTAAYLEVDATYLVPAGSPLKSIADVDRAGIRIGVGEKSAYDLYLSRTLKHAQLVRVRFTEAAFKHFVAEKLDAFAGLKPQLVAYSGRLPGSRVLDGRFSVVQQASGTPKGREAGARYLADFIEDAKASGLVARLIEKNGIRGVDVAPSARVMGTVEIGGSM